MVEQVCTQCFAAAEIDVMKYPREKRAGVASKCQFIRVRLDRRLLNACENEAKRNGKSLHDWIRELLAASAPLPKDGLWD